jgi:hypothetical protein
LLRIWADLGGFKNPLQSATKVQFYEKVEIFKIFYDFWQNIFLKIKIFQKNICPLKLPQVNSYRTFHSKPPR